MSEGVGLRHFETKILSSFTRKDGTKNSSFFFTFKFQAIVSSSQDEA